MPFCCFEAFLEKFIEKFSFLEKKVAISETSTEILKKFVFLTMFERGKSREKLEFG